MSITDQLAAVRVDYAQLKRDTTRYDSTRRQLERIAFTHALRCPTCGPIADQHRQQHSARLVIDLAEAAANVIDNNGYCRTFLWDVRQAKAGTPLNRCAVDLTGAVLVAAHGTPRHLGSPLTRAAEHALEQRAHAPSLAAWASRPGSSKDAAIQLARDTAADLRAVAA